MSALSLKYPFKPNDLADDLESFIHVITYCSLRFHWHDKTSGSLNSGVLPERLFHINSSNVPLAQHVYNLYEESTRHGDVYTGGWFKYLTNSSVSPDFVLSRNVSAELLTLVKRLYELLAAQYAELDLAYLAQYGLPIFQPSPSDVYQPSDMDVAAWQREMLRRGPPPPSQRNAQATQAEVPKPPRSKVLNTHQSIKAVFVGVYRTIFDKVEQGIPPKSDKTLDQFYGLL